MGELLDQYLGQGTAALSKEERRKKEPRTHLLDEYLGLRKPETEKPVGLSDVARQAFAESTAGLALRGTGAWDYEDPELGWAGETAAMLGSFVIDPVTYIGGGIGGKIAGKLIAKGGEKLLERTALRAAERFAIKGIPAATTLATITAVHDPLQQYIDTGDVKWLETARRTAKSAVLGEALGAAGAAAGPLAVPAEIGVGAVGSAALEGRAPTTRDVGDWAAMVIAMRLAGKVSEAAKRRLLKSYRERVEAGQEVPIPNAEEFKRETGDNLTQRERDAMIRIWLEGEAEAEAKAPPTASAAPPLNAAEPAGPTAPPEMVEVVPGVFGPPGAVSIQNAYTDALREQLGLGGRLKTVTKLFDRAAAEGNAKLEAEPDVALRLIDEFKRKPRPHEPWEVYVLTRELAIRQTHHTRALKESYDAEKAGNVAKVAEFEPQVAYWEAAANDLISIVEVAETTGTAASHSLAARKMFVDKDNYGIARMLYQTRTAKGKKILSPEEIKEVERQFNEIRDKAETDAKLDLEAQTVQAEAGVKAFIAQTQKGDTPKRRAKQIAKAQKELDQAWNEFVGEFGGTLFSIEAVPRVLPGMLKLTKAYVNLKFYRFLDFFEQVIKRIGKEKAEKIRPQLEVAFAQAVEEAKPVHKAKAPTTRSLHKLAQELSTYFVSRGTEDYRTLIDQVHGELKLIAPLTRLQSAQAIPGYRDFTPATEDEVKLKVYDLTMQTLEHVKQQDMAMGIAPGKTGRGRPKPSDELRAMIRETNKAKREGKYDVVDPTHQLQGVLDTMETRLKHRIADVSKELRTGEEILKKQETKTEPTEAQRQQLARIEALRDELAELNGWREEVFGRPELTPEQRLDIAMKAADRSVERYEKMLETGELGPEPKVEKTPVTEQLARKRQYRDALRREVQLRRQAAEWTRRLVEGEFTTPKREAKVEALIPKELQERQDKARYEAEQAKARFRRGLEKDRFRRMSVVEKTVFLGGEVLNTARAVLTSMDFSAVLRQGGFVVAGHPLQGLAAMKPMFEAFRSPVKAARAMRKIMERANAKSGLYKRSGLALSDLEGGLYGQEEAYMGRIVHRIPGVAASERAYVVFLNRLRADLFDSLANSLGVSGRITDAQGKVIANYVNAATGRSNLGHFQAASTTLATVFFAPRYVASRFALLFGQPLWRGDATTRTAIVKEYARALTGLGIFYASANLALQAYMGDPGQEWNIETDPRSSDFAKIRMGDTRIDPMMGLQQVSVLTARVLGGKTKTRKGKVVPLRGDTVPYGGSDVVDVLARFGRTKFSPSFGAAVDILAGKDVVGEPTTPLGVLGGLTMPLSLGDIYQAMKREGVPTGTALGLLSIFGMSIQTQVPKRRRDSKRTVAELMGEAA